MKLPSVLNQQIVDFLRSLPNIHDSHSQRAFVSSAGLDTQLQGQITFGGPPTQFFQMFVDAVLRYGQLEDGRNALIAVLEAAKQYVGQDRRSECDTIIREIQEYMQSNEITKREPEKRKIASSDRISKGGPEEAKIASALLSYEPTDDPFIEMVANSLCQRGIVPLFDKNDLNHSEMDFVEDVNAAVSEPGTPESKAEPLADNIAQRVYTLLNFKQAKDVNIVIDQRGKGSRREPYTFPPTVANLAAHPTLVFRPDFGERSFSETLVGEKWAVFRQNIDRSLSNALGSLRSGMNIRILGDAQLGIPFLLGRQFDRTSCVDLYCYNVRHHTMFTNAGQERDRLLSGGNPNCEIVQSQPLSSPNIKRKIERLHQRLNELEKLLELLGQRRFVLEKQKVVENRAEEKFRIEQLLVEIDAEYKEIEKSIDDVETRLSNHNPQGNGSYQEEELYIDFLPQKLLPGKTYHTVSLYIGKRDYLPAVHAHLEDRLPFVFIETGKFFDTSDEVMEFVRDVMAVLKRLRTKNNTSKVCLYCDLPFNIVPLLSANLTFATDTIEFLEHRKDLLGKGCPPSDMYVHLPIE